MGKAFHKEHFLCGGCGTSLTGQSFYEEEGRALCSACKGRGPSEFVCTKCTQPITGRVINALGQKWHESCFVCTTCQQPFAEGRFHDIYGKPYCDAHSASSRQGVKKCPTCQNQVDENNAIVAMGLLFHPSCFKCGQCGVVLGTGSYKGHNNRPYCHEHVPSGLQCAACNQKIQGSLVQAMGKRWHPDHFVCAYCHAGLQNKAWKDKNDKPYCTTCWSKVN